MVKTLSTIYVGCFHRPCNSCARTTISTIKQRNYSKHNGPRLTEYHSADSVIKLLRHLSSLFHWAAMTKLSAMTKYIQKTNYELSFWRWTRVDVSQTFSADQVWFRRTSGLFQRCSLPENLNLWTALIQLWAALKTPNFRARNQRWFSPKQLWNWNISEQKNQRWIRAVSTLIFSEIADFLWNSAETLI